MDESSPKLYAQPAIATNYIRALLPEPLQKPLVAIVCGSGLGGIQETIESSPQIEIAYGDVPHFPVPTGGYLTSIMPIDTL